MNDHDAVDQIAEVLDEYFKEAHNLRALARICQIIGQNAIEHAAAKEAQK